MRTNILLLILLPIIVLLSCAEDLAAPQVLDISEHNIHFSGHDGSWLLTIKSNTHWQVKGANDWCKVDTAEGYNTGNLTISVTTNDTKKLRSNRLEIISELDRIEVNIEQDSLSGEHHYELPVIFHLIYADRKEIDAAKDSIENPKAEVISNIITKCNELYRNNINSIDMNLQLVPATHTPDGVPLSEIGIKRTLRTNSAYKKASSFLNTDNTIDGDLLWDPNKYINVFVFTFVEGNVSGMAILPHTPRQNSLPGLTANHTFYKEIPNFPWGIALNNTYINEKDAYQTMAHELGHYLGLYHIFAADDCNSETDYCEDTQSYNRKEYDKWLAENSELTIPQKYKRNACNGIEFTSYNAMDYYFSYMNRFTADQFDRVRHVLEYSPLIPGPKNIVVTRSLAEETEAPIVTVIE